MRIGSDLGVKKLGIGVQSNTALITLFFSLTLTSLLYATKPVEAATGEAIADSLQALSGNGCSDLLLGRGTRGPVTRDAIELDSALREIAAACPSPTACTTTQLRTQYQRASERHPSTSLMWLTKQVIYMPGRIGVLAIWAGAVGGAYALSNWLTQGSTEQVQSVTSFMSMFFADRVAGRVMSPITEQYGAWADQLGAWMWQSNSHYGKVARGSALSDREAAGEVAKLLYTINDYLSEGAQLVGSGDMEAAAEHYLDAILTSAYLHAHINLDEIPVIKKARFYLKKYAAGSATDVDALIARVLKRLHAETPDHLPKNLTTEQLEILIDSTLRLWFEATLPSTPIALKDAA
jgi:hypothetical protein